MEIQKIQFDGNVTTFDDPIILDGTDSIKFTAPITIAHYDKVFKSEYGVTLQFEGQFTGSFIGFASGEFFGLAVLDEGSDISKPLHKDKLFQGLLEDYFYNHFVDWIKLDNEKEQIKHKGKSNNEIYFEGCSGV